VTPADSDGGEPKTEGPSGPGFAEVVGGGAEVGTSADPAELVRQVREGQIDVDHAVDQLIERAMEGELVASAPEELRQEIRRALGELAREDPTLAALVGAMKR
jgi:hypothetical protein